MFKILIVNEKDKQVVLDLKTKSLVLSALDETGGGVKSLAMNDAHLIEVAQVLAGANAAVKRTSMDHPFLPGLVGLFSKTQSTEEAGTRHGRD